MRSRLERQTKSRRFSRDATRRFCPCNADGFSEDHRFINTSRSAHQAIAHILRTFSARSSANRQLLKYRNSILTAPCVFIARQHGRNTHLQEAHSFRQQEDIPVGTTRYGTKYPHANCSCPVPNSPSRLFERTAYRHTTHVSSSLSTFPSTTYVTTFTMPTMSNALISDLTSNKCLCATRRYSHGIGSAPNRRST
jgi:hypothetical protein